MIIKASRFLFIFATLFTVASCNLQRSNQPLPRLEYLEGAAKFDIDKFFNNDLSGFAIILDENEKVIDKVEVNSTGSWSGTKGTVKFEYVYKNNRKDYRTWLITKNNSESFSIVAHDFVGGATGRQAGNVSEMIYKMNYKFKGNNQELKFVDTLYQVNSNSVISITELYSKGKKIGKIITSLSKSSNKSSVTNSADNSDEENTSSNEVSATLG